MKDARETWEPIWQQTWNDHWALFDRGLADDIRHHLILRFDRSILGRIGTLLEDSVEQKVLVEARFNVAQHCREPR